MLRTLASGFSPGAGNLISSAPASRAISVIYILY
jgi:hypothetical protein